MRSRLGELQGTTDKKACIIIKLKSRCELIFSMNGWGTLCLVYVAHNFVASDLLSMKEFPACLLQNVMGMVDSASQAIAIAVPQEQQYAL